MGKWNQVVRVMHILSLFQSVFPLLQEIIPYYCETDSSSLCAILFCYIEPILTTFSTQY